MAATLLIVLAWLLADMMPAKWSVAFWSLIAAVVLSKALARKVIRKRMGSNRALEVSLELGSMVVWAIVFYVFAAKLFPGMR